MEEKNKKFTAEEARLIASSNTDVILYDIFEVIKQRSTIGYDYAVIDYKLNRFVVSKLKALGYLVFLDSDDESTIYW